MLRRRQGKGRGGGITDSSGIGGIPLSITAGRVGTAAANPGFAAASAAERRRKRECAFRAPVPCLHFESGLQVERLAYVGSLGWSWRGLCGR
jgi:hypothetical protein